MKKLFIIPALLSTCIAFQSAAKGGQTIIIDNDDSVRIVIGDTIKIYQKEQHGKDGQPGKNQDIEIILNDYENAIEEIRKITKRKNETTTTEKKTTTTTHTSKKRSIFKTDLLVMDVGLNGFVDNTNYASAEVANFVRVDDNVRNERLFNIKSWSSRNINLWPVMFSLKAVNTPNQRVLFTSGFGFQFYSFKYSNPLKLNGGLDPHFILTDNDYRKNKLGITYISIPLMLTGQTKMNKSKWLTYGVGVIGGYKIDSWTKQKSASHGKVKDKDPYAMNPFQLSLTGEFGVKGLIRFYATYQLTNMWDDRTTNMTNPGLVQQPFAIGLRFFGI